MGLWEKYAEGNRTEMGASLWHNGGHISLDRLGEARLAQCFAIWTPEAYRGADALAFYRAARDWFHQHVDAEADHLARPANVADADAILDEGRAVGLLTVEGGGPVGQDLAVIDEMAADGVRMFTLTWNGPNAIASGHDTHEGISAFGRTAVARLEEKGIVIDVSHLNDEGFWDLAKIARKPFVASHSNARAVCSHLRNLTDSQFEAIRDAGGVVGINYCVFFLRDGGTTQDVTFDDLSRHVDHLLSLGGEDVLALGSDYDGSTVPAWLDGCENLAPFYHQFAARFGEDLAKKVFYTNARDFFVRYQQL